MSTGWTIFISVLVIGNLIGVMWLLLATSSKKNTESSGPIKLCYITFGCNKRRFNSYRKRRSFIDCRCIS